MHIFLGLPVQWHNLRTTYVTSSAYRKHTSDQILTFDFSLLLKKSFEHSLDYSNIRLNIQKFVHKVRVKIPVETTYRCVVGHSEWINQSGQILKMYIQMNVENLFSKASWNRL